MSDFDLAHPVDDTFIDRIVDGDLSPAELRAALDRLDREPDGWKRCCARISRSPVLEPDIPRARRHADRFRQQQRHRRRRRHPQRAARNPALADARDRGRYRRRCLRARLAGPPAGRRAQPRSGRDSACRLGRLAGQRQSRARPRATGPSVTRNWPVRPCLSRRLSRCRDRPAPTAPTLGEGIRLVGRVRLAHVPVPMPRSRSCPGRASMPSGSRISRRRSRSMARPFSSGTVTRSTSAGD